MYNAENMVLLLLFGVLKNKAEIVGDHRTDTWNTGLDDMKVIICDRNAEISLVKGGGGF